MKEEKTYTLDELKEEVGKFREFLLNVCDKNKCLINIEFMAQKFSDINVVSNIESSINVQFNGRTENYEVRL